MERYSLNKIMTYHKAGRENMMDETRFLSNAVRAAYHADKRQFKEFTESLEAKDE